MTTSSVDSKPPPSCWPKQPDKGVSSISEIRKKAWPERCPIKGPWWFTFSRSTLIWTDSLMREQGQCIHENMSKKNRQQTAQRPKPLFSRHFIETVNDANCPLIEG